MKKIEFIENIKIIKTFKRVKTINLRVRDGKVEILCPFFTLKSSIKNLIKEREIAKLTIIEKRSQNII